MRSGTLMGVAALTLATVLGAAPAFAHHSSAMFDADQEVTFSGTVKGFQNTNPHSWLQVMVVDKAGKQTLWSFENEGPSTLLRMGIKGSTFKLGDKVTLVGHPMRDGRPAAHWVTVTTSDGKTYGRNVPNAQRKPS
jgi:Family of unknown function (DUF6152)